MSHDLDQLRKAREVLVRERRTRTATIASTSGSIGDQALDAFIKVQETIEAVDAAIEELEAIDYDEEDDE